MVKILDKKKLIMGLAALSVTAICIAAYSTGITHSMDNKASMTLSLEDTMESTNDNIKTADAIPEVNEELMTAAYVTADSADSTDTSTRSASPADIGIDDEIFSNIQSDIAGIKQGDPDTVAKYFGTSDVFTPEKVADRVSTTNITLVSSTALEDGNFELLIHVCTIDYNKMNSDYKAAGQNADSTAAKKQVTRNLINGDYSICYNIPVLTSGDGIVISEAFKQAITGGWYIGAGVELSSAECILK